MPEKQTRNGRPSQRIQQREETRKGLLKAARRLFTTLGVESVSMEKIGSEAGVSRATIYLHFSGKPALLEALLIEDWSGQIKLFEKLRGKDMFSGDQLERWLMRVAEGMRNARDSFSIHRAALGQNPELTFYHQRHKIQLAQLLLEAIGAAKGHCFDREATICAELIVAEIDYFATAAAIAWSHDELSTALPIVAARLREFGQAERAKSCEAHRTYG